MWQLGILFLLASAWWPQTLGFLSLVGVVALILFPVRRWEQGATASMMLLAGHLWWLPGWLYSHVQTTFLGTIGIPLFLTVWFGAIAIAVWRGVWLFSSTPRVKTGAAYLLFYTIITYASTPFVSFTTGYPLLMPHLPFLAWIKPLISEPLRADAWWAYDTTHALLYFPPVRIESRAQAAYAIYKRLFAIPEVLQGTKKYWIIAPESLFPYALSSIISEQEVLWCSALPQQTRFIFGGFYKGTMKNHAVFELQTGPIRELFEKKNLVDFFETTIKTNSYLTKLFFQSCGTFATSEEHGCMLREEGWCYQLCADALLFQKKPGMRLVFVLANETVLPAWVAALWQSYIAAIALCQDIDVVWVGHGEGRIYRKNFFCYHAIP